MKLKIEPGLSRIFYSFEGFDKKKFINDSLVMTHNLCSNDYGIF